MDKALDEYLKKFPEMKFVPTYMNPDFGFYYMNREQHMAEFTERNPQLAGILGTYLDIANKRYEAELEKNPELARLDKEAREKYEAGQKELNVMKDKAQDQLNKA